MTAWRALSTIIFAHQARGGPHAHDTQPMVTFVNKKNNAHAILVETGRNSKAKDRQKEKREQLKDSESQKAGHKCRQASI